MTTAALPTTASGVAGGYAHPSPSSRIVADALREVGGHLDLTASYEICRRINAAHGRTYYWATRLLPAHKRPHVHALYAFARYADDLVDHLDLDHSPADRRAALESWADAFLADLARGHTDDPVGKAVVHTVTTLDIDRGDLQAFLRSMAMDLTVDRYATYADLYDYMYGSAAVIGSMMLPVLEPTSCAARQPAMDLGVAFQLTNFIRDVAEDLQRGRIYLPLEDLDRFGVDAEQLRRREVTPALRRLLAFQIARARSLYARARAGWALLPPASARCVRTAHHLYEAILDQVEASDYQVFRVRASVPAWKKAVVTLAQLGTPVPAPGADLHSPSTLYHKAPPRPSGIGNGLHTTTAHQPPRPRTTSQPVLN